MTLRARRGDVYWAPIRDVAGWGMRVVKGRRGPVWKGASEGNCIEFDVFLWPEPAFPGASIDSRVVLMIKGQFCGGRKLNAVRQTVKLTARL